MMVVTKVVPMEEWRVGMLECETEDLQVVEREDLMADQKAV